MLNVKSLTDTMSRMELPQLQQYAALHKNDPYVVTLALSIANQKKQMKAAQDGQGVMPQSTVVDRDIFGIPLEPEPRGAVPPQQALPEDSGIAQLPAQNMQRMAGGGIVAFDDGGSVPGYAGGVFTGEEDMPEWLKVFPPESGFRRTYRAMQQYDKNNPMPVRPAALAAVTTAPAAAPALPPSATQVMSGLPATPVVPPAPSIGAKPPVPVAIKPAAPAAVKPTTPADLMAGIKTLDTKPMSPEEAATASKAFGEGSELTAGINQLRSDALQTNKDVAAAYQEGLAKLPKPGEEAEARLRKREAEDAVSQADAKAMAIFKAGLGMLAGTSQNAFENIGKGAMVGLEDYSSSIKEFRKLGMERDKAYAEIENARAAAARDDFKTSVGLQEKAADRLARVNEKGVDITATLFKTNKEAATAIWKDSNLLASANARSMNELQGAANRSVFEQGEQTKRSAFEQGEQTKRTAMQLSAPPAEARMAMMLGTGSTSAEKLESGLKKIQDLQSDKTGKVYAELYAKHVEDSRKNMTEPMTPTEFAASMRGVLTAMSPKVVTAPGANAPVYNRP